MDKQQCAEMVFGEHRHFACFRNATVLVGDKWYCWQHDPEYKKKVKKKREGKWQRESDDRKRKWRRQDAEVAACKGVPTEALKHIRIVDLLEAQEKE